MSESPSAHTRVPNLISDVVIPLLPPAEGSCLMYIIRRTYGFADPNGGRKERDTISLEQFQNGITSGEYLLDLGTQLSRNTIRKALEGLEEKKLILTSYSCLRCYWEGESHPENDARTQAPACPRCGATLSRSWALAELRPSLLERLLNEYDKKGRRWRWDSGVKRFAFENVDQRKRKSESQDDQRAEIERLRALLWYPELVDQAIERASKGLKRPMTLKRKLDNFYRVVWEMQEESNNPGVLEYALKETLKKDVLDGPETRRWYRYPMAIIQRRNASIDSGSVSSSVASEGRDERDAQQILGRCAELNDTGRQEEARSLLSDLLARTETLAALFDGDERLCEWKLRLAFKQGSTDLVGVEIDPHEVDFYPEWDPTEKR